jgi:hypothetical protein
MSNQKLIESEKQFIKERIERNKKQIEDEAKNENSNFGYILFLMSGVENDLKLLALMDMRNITLEEAQKILSDITFPI